MFGVGEGNFTQDRDFSGVINTGGVFAQGGIEPFKGGTPSAREWFPGDVFVLVLFFHFYPKPSGFGFKENGTIPFYAIFLKKVLPAAERHHFWEPGNRSCSQWIGEVGAERWLDTKCLL
jgi:hypothetical protein